MISKILENSIKEIKLGGYKILKRKFLTFIYLIFTSPLFYFLSILILLIVYSISPIITFRFGHLSSSRLGHFIGNTELYMCEKKAGIDVPRNFFLDIFFLHDISNFQIAKMLRRELIIYPKIIVEPIYLINKALTLLSPFFKKFEISTTYSDRDVHNLLDKTEPNLSFTNEEIEEGEKFLNKYGLNKNSKFVCFIIRDEKYLNERFPEKDWSYHNHRNYNSDNFLEAAKALTYRGYTVFRMGLNVKKKFFCKNKMIIDYANLPERSDFLDVYLGANCNFCLSTACGYDQIPQAFRKPVANITVPIQYFVTSSEKFLIMAPHHFSKKLKRNLKFSELIENKIGACIKFDHYEKKGIELIENTPEEIREFALEMADRCENKWQDTQDDKKNQLNFWTNYENKLLETKDLKKLHGKLVAKFSTSFIKKNPEWIS